MMKLYIKNMVSKRCKMLVKSELEKLGLHAILIELGEVKIQEDLSSKLLDNFNKNLKQSGLELVEDKNKILIEKLKSAIIEMVHFSDELPKIKFADYLSEKLNHSYTYMANLFSENEGITIEHFFLYHKIEHVKELLIYGEHNLSDIAFKMRYSSVAHLSSQFKKITGLTPTEFKNLKHK